MSSGFVSGGTVDAPVERDDEWRAAQKELEDLRRKRAEESKQNDGRSLFEILEANKAAKQEAFEEANKLKHQFQTLNEDEAEFLDSIMESTRKEEERVKKETKERLETFRQQQELADKRVSDDAAIGDVEEEQWATGPRKRKRAQERLKGVKLRKSSTGDREPVTAAAAGSNPSSRAQPPTGQGRNSPQASSPSGKAPPTPVNHALSDTAATEKSFLAREPEAVAPKIIHPVPSGQGLLVDYGSDEDDD